MSRPGLSDASGEAGPVWHAVRAKRAAEGEGTIKDGLRWLALVLCRTASYRLSEPSWRSRWTSSTSGQSQPDYSTCPTHATYLGLNLFWTSRSSVLFRKPIRRASPIASPGGRP